jgi:hypothetical protein
MNLVGGERQSSTKKEKGIESQKIIKISRRKKRYEK